MKKILIIEDDPLVGNVFYNHLMSEGYYVKSVTDGESGLSLLREFKADLILLDLILPNLSGIEVIKRLRSDREFKTTPIMVFTNAFETVMVQEAWKAGATKCIAKANCSPKELLHLLENTMAEKERDRNVVAPFGLPATAAPAVLPGDPALSPDTDFVFREGLRKNLVENLPGTLKTLRTTLQKLIKADSDPARLKLVHTLYRRVHALAGNAGIAGLTEVAQLAAALEAVSYTHLTLPTILRV